MKIETWSAKKTVVEISVGKRVTRRSEALRTRHYFRLVAANGEIIAQSEGYNSKAARSKTVRLIQRTNWNDVEVVEGEP